MKGSDQDKRIGKMGKMSANGITGLFVGVGRFWYLSSWAFGWIDWHDTKFGIESSMDVGTSLNLVDDVIAGVVEGVGLAL